MNRMTMLRTAVGVYGRISPRAAGQWALDQFTKPRRRAPRDWEREVEARAERERLKVGWSVLRWGTGRKRILCMHGWEGRATQFDRMASELAQGDATVLAVDGPGHGHSPGREAHPIAFARTILEADRELGPFHCVIGHSMGAGSTALALTWGLRTDSVALLAGPSSMKGVLDRFANYIGLPARARPDFQDLVTRSVGFRADEIDIARLGAQISIPALLLHDREDTAVPFADGVALSKGWPSAQFVPLEGKGHHRLLGDADVIARVVEFARARHAATALAL